jgi:septal ring factor EnvC (AmiA/AmiB activator)
LQLFADPPLLLARRPDSRRETRGQAKQERGQPARFRIPLLRGLTESIKSVSVWKLASVVAAAAFVISLCAYSWVSIDRKIQKQKLQQAYESINKLVTKYEETRQQARLYEFDMMSWRSEAEQSKRALLSTESELQNARKNLSETRKDLDNMQQYNNETLKDLNEQITKIRSRIPIAGE